MYIIYSGHSLDYPKHTHIQACICILYIININIYIYIYNNNNNNNIRIYKFGAIVTTSILCLCCVYMYTCVGCLAGCSVKYVQCEGT